MWDSLTVFNVPVVYHAARLLRPLRTLNPDWVHTRGGIRIRSLRQEDIAMLIQDFYTEPNGRLMQGRSLLKLNIKHTYNKLRLYFFHGCK